MQKFLARQGLLSAVDAILDMKMQDVVREILLEEEIREALLGEQTDCGKFSTWP